ncbi:hypothetical protein [Novosphingobium sp.]|uniref:hypothetical protein n=1 Tax=Novosphingobium sp. TaxID=1874826 RepID=UPI003B525160
MTCIRQTAALAALILIAACAKPAPQQQADNGPVDAHRVALPPADPAPANDDGKAVWSKDGETARFGFPGGSAMLTLACEKGRLVITRPIVAELGAGALFAIEGPRRIVRIPVDATPLQGQRGFVWQGTMDGTNEDTDVFAGPFTGTLPGGGLIKVTAGEPARDIVHRCHAKQT